MKLFPIIFLSMLFYTCNTKVKSTSDLMTPRAFSDELKNNTAIVLLDLRTPEEIDKGFISGAKNINFNSPDFSKSLDSLDLSATYLIYCGSGKRSAKAQLQMQDKGFKHVTGLDGGFNAWRAEGLPIEISN